MRKDGEIEDINVWEPKDPKKPYLIWGKNWKPLETGEVILACFQQKKCDYLKIWRKKYCDEVDANEFNKRIKNNAQNRDFSGLVFPKGGQKNIKIGFYNFAIFTNGAVFSMDRAKNENSDKRYNFIGTKFQGRFMIESDCVFEADFPFSEATICNDSHLLIAANSQISFKKSKTGSLIREPFGYLKIQEGGTLNFFTCSFPDGFTLRNLNLKNSCFGGSNIEEVRFINCEFAEEKGSLFAPVRPIFADEKRGEISHSELAVMYQLMKKSFEEQKDYQTAGKFYVSEMVFRQKEATGIRKIFLSLYGIFAGYGESIWRTGFLLVLCILFSILLYACSASFSFSEAPNAAFSSLLLFKNTDHIIFADILSRLIFVPAIFLFLNAIRRRLRRSWSTF